MQRLRRVSSRTKEKTLGNDSSNLLRMEVNNFFFCAVGWWDMRQKVVICCAMCGLIGETEELMTVEMLNDALCFSFFVLLLFFVRKQTRTICGAKK